MNLMITPQATVVPEDAKWAFTARRVVRADVADLSTELGQAVSGDLVLGQIVRIGHHKRIQLAEGRPSELYVGDHVVLACGDRYAPDQFEGVGELDPEGADLLAAGGLLGRVRQAKQTMAAPTRIKPVGLLANRDGHIINIAGYGLSPRLSQRTVPVIGVIGASMNAGKTTAAASLGHGLSRAGLRVAALKVTGTGAFGDFNAYRDAGIPLVADFTDVGMASTYRQPLDRIEDGFQMLFAHVTARGAEAVVVELADGVFQEETAALLRSSRIRDSFSGILFAAPDALGAVGGVRLLREIGLEPFAVSGTVSCSPLAAAEAEAAARIPVVAREGLRDPSRVTELVGSFVNPSDRASRPASCALEVAA